MSPTLAIITGASSGIGLAIAERHLAAGNDVIGVSRRPCPLSGVQSVELDLTSIVGDSAGLDRIATRVPESSRVHLVHAAATMARDDALQVDPETLERSLRLNVVVPALIDAALLPRMGPGSSIVFVASTLSEKAVAGRLSYVASKHALLGLMRATVQDLFGRGVHALCVAPGFVDTPMLRPVLDSSPAFEKAVLEMVSFGRLIEPREIAELVEFASRTPSLNGAIVHANLGQREV